MRYADIADAVKEGQAVALTIDSELCNMAQTQLMVRKIPICQSRSIY